MLTNIYLLKQFIHKLPYSFFTYITVIFVIKAECVTYQRKKYHFIPKRKIDTFLFYESNMRLLMYENNDQNEILYRSNTVRKNSHKTVVITSLKCM